MPINDGIWKQSIHEDSEPLSVAIIGPDASSNSTEAIYRFSDDTNSGVLEIRGPNGAVGQFVERADAYGSTSATSASLRWSPVPISGDSDGAWVRIAPDSGIANIQLESDETFAYIPPGYVQLVVTIAPTGSHNSAMSIRCKV